MDLVDPLFLGLSVALTPANLLCCLVGCILGTLIGVLPGIGPVAAIAMLLPATHSLPPVAALILLAGIYYGAQYGGSTSAILANLPGEPSSDVTRIDGHQMAQHGLAGPALGAAALGSFFAGCVGTLLLAVGARPLTALAAQLGPVENFSLLVLAMTGVAVLASGSLLKSFAMIVLGLLLGLVGTDALSGVTRFGFDRPELRDGIGFVALAMGLFGYGEIIANLSQRDAAPQALGGAVRGVWPSRQHFAALWPAVLRGTALGTVLGLVPGGGALLASFAAYSLEKTMPLHAGEVPFGKGNIRGVAAPESANNAGAQTAFLPLLALGMPPNAVMALMLGALALRGISPGEQLVSGIPALFWGLVVSMWVGNVLLVVLNLPLIGLWVRLLRVPYRLLYPVVVLACAIGIYSTRGRSLDVWLVGGFGALGYLFVKLRSDPAPLLLGAILAPTMEDNLRRSLTLSSGDWRVFVTEPVSAGLLGAAALLVVMLLVKPRRGVKAGPGG